jgi:hypothetical protein
MRIIHIYPLCSCMIPITGWIDIGGRGDDKLYDSR